ncbi:hypothetical protein LTR09_008115 [Extremus antarcticus]|uniref:Copper acquisition factor BIM1-like domain-containing protein n=1 Tax=Extremus antarcticus TaxID=702011 RepID=A0AAJ0GAP6_9PEZI|nr:hypothetical protein LTR09_008115 [Extremus antarcticus]
MPRLSAILAVAATWSTAAAHTVITYPGWRGNNLHTTGLLPQFEASNIGINYNSGNDTYNFPYGMQWMYPCGGMPLSENRTKWPVGGGAVSIQPGWFPGHSKALFYVNMGINGPGQVAPPNMSHPLVPPFQVLGPTNEEFAGQFCLPQVPMPVNATLGVGANVTIQIIEVAQHGAALYNCVDVTLVEPQDMPKELEVTPQNCYNSSDLSFELLFTSAALSSGAMPLPSPAIWPLFAVVLVSAAATFL